jgi:hypothetical protein
LTEVFHIPTFQFSYILYTVGMDWKVVFIVALSCWKYLYSLCSCVNLFNMFLTYQYEFTVFWRNNGPVIQHACKAHVTSTAPYNGPWKIWEFSLPCGGKHIVVGTVTVTSIFSFFCTVIRFSAIMVQSVNDFWIHGCWFSMWYPSYEPEALCLASQLIEIRHC